MQSGSREPLILLEDGKTVGAIIPTDDDDLEGLLLSISPQFQSVLERSQQRLELEGGVPSADVRIRLGLAQE